MEISSRRLLNGGRREEGGVYLGRGSKMTYCVAQGSTHALRGPPCSCTYRSMVEDRMTLSCEIEARVSEPIAMVETSVTLLSTKMILCVRAKRLGVYAASYVSSQAKMSSASSKRNLSEHQSLQEPFQVSGAARYCNSTVYTNIE